MSVGKGFPKVCLSLQVVSLYRTEAQLDFAKREFCICFVPLSRLLIPANRLRHVLVDGKRQGYARSAVPMDPTPI